MALRVKNSLAYKQEVGVQRDPEEKGVKVAFESRIDTVRVHYEILVISRLANCELDGYLL